MSAATIPSAGMQYPPSQYSSQPSLPANLTQQGVRQIYEEYQHLKDQGTRDDDPHMVKLQNQLKAVRDQVSLQRQRHQYLQHTSQQQPFQNGDGQHAMANGAHMAGSPGHEPQFNNTQNLHADVNASQPPAQKQPPDSIHSIYSEEQKTMLRTQMMAFKLLSRNQPIPLEIQQMIFPSQKNEKSPTPLEVIDAASQALEPASQPAKEDGTDQTVAQAVKHPGYESIPEKYLRLQQPVPYAQFAKAVRARPRLAGVLPTGVDVDRVRQERENIVYNQIQSRKAELEKLGANIDAWDTSVHDTPHTDGALKRKALIEYKMLCLLPKQRALRQQISREMVLADNLAMTANRSLYRREKKANFREAQFTEKFEKEQRNARELQEKKKHSDYLHSIVKHRQEVLRAAAEQKARVARFSNLMKDQHKTIEREEQKRVERTARQRLQALKANDEETYLKLLGQAKDSRISHLLKQTDTFLNQLAASVKSQQRSAQERYGNGAALSEEPESDIEEDPDGEGAERIDYYEVAHRIKENVTVQSSNLVGGELKEYQIKGLQWMISLYNNNLNGILADEMGLGKTIQTISLITYLIQKKNQNGPFLVVVPLSTLTNWNNEFEKWAPSVQRIVYKGPPAARKAAQAQIRYGQFQVMLTTYEFIIKDRPVLSKIKWLHMIVDEGHRMKNSQSRLSTTITQYYTTRYRIILTGTPLQNNLPELWALLNFVLPNIFKSAKTFDEWFNTPFANTGGQDKVDLTEEEKLLVIRRLHKVLRPFLLRRLKKDVEKDLPDKQEKVIKCKFSSLQARLYKQLMNDNKMVVSDGKGGKTGMRGLSNMMMQLRKLCNHPFVFEEIEDQVNPQKLSNDLLWRSAGKFELLDRILPKFQRTGHRVLMFFQMTQIMNIMEDFMRLRGLTYLRLDGSTKADERADLLKEFNADNSPYFCFLLSTRAGGLGLNLQTADTVIIYDSDWNPHQDLQAQDRAHRIGQKNEVRILRLITTGSIEEKILERANYKLDMDGKVIQAGKFDNKSTNEERDAMLRVMLESAESVDNLEQEEMDDDDLNELMMRSEDELEVFQRLDAERAQDPIYGNGKTPRLIADNELPSIWLTDDVPGATDEIEEAFGRGARERTRVRYDDGLTEEQWLDAVDNDEDSIEAAIARKRERIERRAGNKEKKSITENGAANSPLPPPSRETSESPAPKKQRGRKPKAEKRKVEEAASIDELPSLPPPRKRGRQAKIPETLSTEERTTLQAVLDNIYDTLMNMEIPTDDPAETTRPVIDAFIKLPDRHHYRDYYAIIKDPICMDQIGKKINRRDYQGLNGFAEDILLLCNNCRMYNEDASVLFQDANTIQDATLDMLRKESQSKPELGKAAFTGIQGLGNGVIGGDAQRNGADSSAAASGNSTPAPAPSGQKLRLNLSGATAKNNANTAVRKDERSVDDAAEGNGDDEDAM